MTGEPNVGTGDYSKKADAVIVGGVYDDGQFNEMRNACAKLPGNGGAAWLRLNMSTPTPPMGSVILLGLVYFPRGLFEPNAAVAMNTP